MGVRESSALLPAVSSRASAEIRLRMNSIRSRICIDILDFYPATSTDASCLKRSHACRALPNINEMRFSDKSVPGNALIFTEAQRTPDCESSEQSSWPSSRHVGQVRSRLEITGRVIPRGECLLVLGLVPVWFIGRDNPAYPRPKQMSG